MSFQINCIIIIIIIKNYIFKRILNKENNFYEVIIKDIKNSKY